MSAPPRDLDRLLDQAIALQQAGRHPEAIALLRGVLAQAPDLPQPAFQLANSLLATGAPAEAEALYRQVAPRHPRPALVQANLASALLAQQRIPAAEAAARRALELNPRLIEALATLAQIQIRRLQPAAAEQSLRQAIAQAPQRADLVAGVADALVRQHRLADALAVYRQGAADFPDNVVLTSNLLWMQMDTDGLDPQAVFEEHAAWGRRQAAALAARGVTPFAQHPNPPDPERPLRLGLVTEHLRRDHPAAAFLTALFRHRDRDQFPLTVYWVGGALDPVGEQFRAWSDGWVDATRLSDDQVAARIHADGIDLLLERGGHGGAYCRLLMYARKPAPVQVAWMGYQATRGMVAIDWFLGDALACLPEADRWFVERVYRLDGPMIAYLPVPPPPESPPTPLPALANGAVTFGVFSRGVKAQPRIMRLWAEILRRLPQARLVIKGQIFGAAEAREQSLARLTAAGVATERVRYLAGTGREKYLAEMEQVDVLLDTFPNTGVTVILDAAWMGVPTVSMRGETCISRMSHSVLTHLGHPEWVAGSDAEYVETAVRLAGDLPALARLRAGLREELRASPLCDGPAHALALQAAFRAMWRAWCQNRH